MERVLQSADAFAFPSRREGFGMAAVEALGCAIPVIAADNRGTREYMKNHENGIVCGFDDPEAFAQAIYNLKNDSDMRAAYAQNAFKSSKQFSKGTSRETLKRIYDRAGL
jgi:glycosyltransferase involved in cell wall biosynthesis